MMQKHKQNVQNAALNGNFSFDSIKNFDNHIELSIPNYNHLWELINSIATYFIVEDSNVYDLGCSTGIGLKGLYLNQKVKNVNYIGYDISKNLIKQSSPVTNNYSIYNQDITKSEVFFPNSSLILTIFTLQFLPKNKKKHLLQKIYNSLIIGGGFIIAEKIIIKTGMIQDIFTFSYYDFKKKSFSKDQILDKQYDLRYIMKNNTSNELLIMLKETGFKYINPFFQSLQFKGWICIK